METPKEYYYTYYSYEKWGRGYFGSRGCYCLPEEDIRYLGSFTDKTFKPTQKIILKSDYATREEAYTDEIILHDFYDVANNPHFANKSKLNSTKFFLSKEQSRELGLKCKENGTGVFSLTPEERREISIKAGIKTKENGTGIFALSKEQLSENSKKANSQRWECLETGYVSNAGALSHYQKARGIDTSKRKRIL
jgi:hypothetical protein